MSTLLEARKVREKRKAVIDAAARASAPNKHRRVILSSEKDLNGDKFSENEEGHPVAGCSHFQKNQNQNKDASSASSDSSSSSESSSSSNCDKRRGNYYLFYSLSILSTP